MNEEFSIALKLAIDESSISQVKERIKQITQELTQTVTISPTGGNTQTIKIDADTTNYTAQIEACKREIEDLQTIIGSLQRTDSMSEEMFNYQVELEKANNRLISLINKQNKLADSTKETTRAVKQLTKASQGIAEAIGQAVSKCKMFTMALIGARSIYFGIRKAMSTYLSQNDALQNKLNACWYALGSLFAPVLEKIISLFAALIGYVNVFLKALGFAGINMSGFASSASSGASSAKQIAKNLSGFDELNNIGSTSSGSSGGASVPDYSGMFDGSNLDTSWVERIQNFGAWCLENIPLITGLLAGVVTTVGLLKAGVEGIKALGIGITVAGIVGTIVSVIEYLKDPTWSNFGNILIGIGTALAGLAIVFGSVPLAIASGITILLGLFSKFKDEINNFILNIEDSITSASNWINDLLTGDGSTWVDWLVNDVIQLFLSTIKSFIEQVRLWLNGAVTFLRSLVDGIKQMLNGDFAGGIKTIFNGLKSFLEAIWDGLVTMFSGTIGKLISLVGQFSSKVWAKIKEFGTNVKNGIATWFSNIATTVSNWFRKIINNYIISPINKVISWLNEKLHFSYSGLRVLGKQVIPSFDVQLAHLNTLPSLAVGTGYVPNDTLAQLHQGEAVIPKKFNSKEYFGGNSDETNSLLQTLINKVDSIELNPYITVKDVGKASVKYINQQARITGNNLI